MALRGFAIAHLLLDGTLWHLNPALTNHPRLHFYPPSCRSIFADDGGPQPLIDPIGRNLSQTPREQCEREGLVGKESRERKGPGQEVIIAGLR